MPASLNNINLLSYNRSTHVFQEILSLILLKVMLAFMGIRCTMIRTEIGFTLAFESKKSQLLIAGGVGTPKGLLDLTHFCNEYHVVV